MNRATKIFLISVFSMSLHALSGDLGSKFHVWVLRYQGERGWELIDGGGKAITFDRAEVGSRIDLMQQITKERGHGNGEPASFTDRSGKVLDDVDFANQFENSSWVELRVGIAANSQAGSITPPKKTKSPKEEGWKQFVRRVNAFFRGEKVERKR